MFLIIEACFALSFKENIDISKLFEWSRKPTAICAHEYFIIGLLPPCLEIRGIKSGRVLQIVQFNALDSMRINCGSDLLLATANAVHRLATIDFDEQIDELIDKNRFSDALLYIDELAFNTPEEKTSLNVKVTGLYARHLFVVDKMYSQAIQLLENIKAHPIDIIQFYPDLTNGGQISDSLALYDLCDYLTRERLRIQKTMKEYPDDVELIAAHELVDTTLMKTFVLTNNLLLSSLVRVQNMCNIHETVSFLSLHAVYPVNLEGCRAD